MKGLVCGFEAYEAHLRTGNYLQHYWNSQEIQETQSVSYKTELQQNNWHDLTTYILFVRTKRNFLFHLYVLNMHLCVPRN